MRILLGMIIVLSFPVLEVYTLVQIHHYIGWWVIALLAGGVLAGWLLIVGERLSFFARITMALQSGGSPVRALINSGRNMIAGALLIFPGILSDLLALFVLLMPLRKLGRFGRRPTPPAPDAFEGEYRREHDDRLGR